MNVFLRIFGYGALVWLATLTTAVYAGTCTTNAKTARMGLLTLAVDPRIEVGEQLAVRTENSINGTTFSFLCSGSVAYRSMSPLTPSALPGVFETGIEGVGVTISDLWQSNKNVPVNTAISPNLLTPWINRNDVRLTFIKTGPIKTGGDMGGKIIARYYLDSTSILDLSISGMKVIQKSCLVDLNYKNQTVNLGSPKRSEFNGVGSTAASSERNFSVVLQCQEDNIPVQVTFEAAGNSPGVGMIDIADGADAAKGVAVEVLDENRNPLTFSRPINYHTAAEKEIRIPLMARYKQTGAISPGQADAVMTFTITQN
ncbi:MULTISPECIES: fimbrial protein [Serratia]|uniref:fimbrial protein n=1 Tax=Serratia TaxID=613 RepID=UPI0009F509E5|nr:MULTISPECIES: fimbrial protein [Serratia]OQV36668.1 adhesin [Serratia nematodiphila]MBH2758010.1 type 1 fimbrial protein [Serratia ureilytica]MBH3124424.1 type 1 fimbrial protein [Serratia ureilytica]NGH07575.1 type 1 fimbrial protein [Serratia marcescens]HCR3023301.1 type 1 fimbrial protein [Serratia marcescens]